MTGASERIAFKGGDEQDVHDERRFVCLSPATVRAAKRSYNRRLRAALRREAAREARDAA